MLRYVKNDKFFNFCFQANYFFFYVEEKFLSNFNFLIFFRNDSKRVFPLLKRKLKAKKEIQSFKISQNNFFDS